MTYTKRILESVFGNSLYNPNWVNNFSERADIPKQTARNWRDNGIEATMDKLGKALEAYNLEFALSVKQDKAA